MKYKVGDKVRVREDLSHNEEYGGFVFIDTMNECRGKNFIIKEVYDYYYKLDGVYTYWYWTDEMLEPIEEVKTIDGYDIEELKQLASKLKELGVKSNKLTEYKFIFAKGFEIGRETIKKVLIKFVKEIK